MLQWFQITCIILLIVSVLINKTKPTKFITVMILLCLLLSTSSNIVKNKYLEDIQKAVVNNQESQIEYRNTCQKGIEIRDKQIELLKGSKE